MKASELRIGNWIKDRGSKEWQIDCWESKNKVAAKSPVLGYCDFTKNQIEGHPLTEEIDFLQPIPLTEEWILKFGFERIEQDDKGNEYCNILYSLNGFDLWFFDFWKSFESQISIKQVHQLQNLYFALTQTELK